MVSIQHGWCTPIPFMLLVDPSGAWQTCGGWISRRSRIRLRASAWFGFPRWEPQEFRGTGLLRGPRGIVAGDSSQPVSPCRFERGGNSIERRPT